MYWCLAAARQPPAALQGKVCVRVPAGWRPRGGLPVRSRGGGGDTGPTFGGGGRGDGEAAAAPCHLDTHTRCSPSWRRAGVTREVETRAGLWRQGRRGGLHGAVCGCGDWQPPASGWPQAQRGAVCWMGGKTFYPHVPAATHSHSPLVTARLGWKAPPPSPAARAEPRSRTQKRSKTKTPPPHHPAARKRTRTAAHGEGLFGGAPPPILPHLNAPVPPPPPWPPPRPPPPLRGGAPLIGSCRSGRRQQ